MCVSAIVMKFSSKGVEVLDKMSATTFPQCVLTG